MALVRGLLEQRLPGGLLDTRPAMDPRQGDVTQRRGFWQEQLAKSDNWYSAFLEGGDRVVDKYRIEQNQQLTRGTDRYNILYSTTETIRPSLYAQTPKCEARKRHQDRTNPTVEQAVNMIETCTQYAMEEVDFDDVMEMCVEDYSLPGWGVAWVRYTAEFENEKDAEGKPMYGEDGLTPSQLLTFEGLSLDYVHWKDFRTSISRNWREVWWVAKRVYMNKEAATAAFGQKVADQLNYSLRINRDEKDNVSIEMQAVVWEIWNKNRREVVWYSDGMSGDVLKVQKDPLRLKGFFPCPRPMRAISNTRSMVPRPFFAQYQAQAEELDNLTLRIRYLTNALQVRGVFDGSKEQLENLLSPTGGNKLIPIQDWQNFVQNKGIKGSIDWVPITEIVNVLMELYKAREIVRGEIYEITGFSDIVRGLSKASETLGAQQIKTEWSGARLRRMQKEVQRFARDIVRIMSEIICEHFRPETLAVYSGFDVPQPDPQYQQAVQQAMAAGQQPPPDPNQQVMQQFMACVKLLRSERERCAVIGIETDSTILPDEEAEKKSRMEFLTAAGAYLQQAGPMIQQFPEMREPLMAIMMFTVRTFAAARPLEQTFESFAQKIQSMPPQDPNKKEGDDGAAKAQAAAQVAQIKEQGAGQRQQAELTAEQQADAAKLAIEREKEQNRHAEKMAELQLREREVAVKEQQLGIQAQEVQLDAQAENDNQKLAYADLYMRSQQQEHGQHQDHLTGRRQDEQFVAGERRQDRQEGLQKAA